MAYVSPILQLPPPGLPHVGEEKGGGTHILPQALAWGLRKPGGAGLLPEKMRIYF